MKTEEAFSESGLDWAAFLKALYLLGVVLFVATPLVATVLGGFKSLSLFQSNFLYFNGLRIIMKPPTHPSKLGVYIEVNVKEYEHYTVRSHEFNQCG